MNHTPEPWKVGFSEGVGDGTKDYDEGCWIVGPHDESIVLGGEYFGHKAGVNSREDAAHIVHCVNTHAALVEAVKLALDYYHCIGTKKYNPYEVEQTLEKALALAEGKETTP